MGGRVDIVQHPLPTKYRDQGTTLIDFIAEFTFPLKKDPDRQMDLPKWKLYVDGSSNENGSEAGLVLISPENHRISSALRFTLKASNNEAEYEVLLAGHRLAKELQVDSLLIFSDSKLVMSQISGEFQARDNRIVACLEKVKAELQKFSKYEVKHIDREDNLNVGALAKLATSKDAELLRLVPVEIILEPSITKQDLEEAIDSEPL